ncbi:hypothetical protein BZA70DRAFT_277351 [Myxozyma melibiosi]|uniref:BAH domain-containing protein n=1 Tax=Myxozyma melibiosi TaxID=54550 RepID=A0ABR1F9Q6_9ASCO
MTPAAKRARIAGPRQSSESEQNGGGGRGVNGSTRARSEKSYAELDDDEDEDDSNGDDEDEDDEEANGASGDSGDSDDEDEEKEKEEDDESQKEDDPSDEPIQFKVVYRGSLAKKSRKRKSAQTKEGEDYPVYEEPADSADYQVEPKSAWNKMQSYRNFIVADEKFKTGEYVFVKNEQSTVASTITDQMQFWVGRVLEIRATDPTRVYVRIFWMYWPNELPGGRRPYHGKRELVASCHQDVIDVMSISTRAPVVHWTESDDPNGDVLGELYWRQLYLSYTNELLPLRQHCKCMQFSNPDIAMIWCSSCYKRLHQECIIDDILDRYSYDIADVETIKAARKADGYGKKGAQAKKAAKMLKGAECPVTIEIKNREAVAKAYYKSMSGEMKEASIICLLCKADLSDAS